MHDMDIALVTQIFALTLNQRVGISPLMDLMPLHLIRLFLMNMKVPI